VVNRAIAKRPYFEKREDKRFFLSRLALEVRAGRLEIHAFCLMTTHFHLLVRSPRGELSEAMRRIQNSYSRYFNRRRRRDGPLIRARFYSKPVDTLRYRVAVVRYIDANAVRACLVRLPAEHEFGSARAFVVGPRPRWLSATWVEERGRRLSGSDVSAAEAYGRAFAVGGVREIQENLELIEARLASGQELDPLDDLIGSTPDQVRRWMESKAKLADSHEVGLPICGPTALLRIIDDHARRYDEWLVEGQNGLLRGRDLATIGLLRDVCSEPFARIGRLLGLSKYKVENRARLHRELVLGDERYRERVSRIALEAVGPGDQV